MKGILQLDLLACDFYRDDAYPSFLYYNPFGESKSVELEVGDEKADLYDLLSHTFIQKEVSGKINFPVEARQPRVIVVTPSGGEISFEGGHVLINNIVVDYGNKTADEGK